MPIDKRYDEMEISELEKLVRRHNRLYFVEKMPEISDAEFDLLIETLKRRKPSSAVLNEIGSDLSEGAEKVRHAVPMLSLDKAYDEKTMKNWASKFKGGIVASPKIDGSAISLRYDGNGRLSVGATRGNGVEGELVTKNVMEVSDIPKKIPLKDVEVRGEVYMKLSVFRRYAAEFANPRNLSAGAIKQKDPKKTAEYNLSFLGYDILGSGARTEIEKMRLLKEIGFAAVPWKLIKAEGIQETFEEFLAKRDSYDFETDGVVYKANDVSEQERLGSTAHHPRYSIAYKFQGDAGETTLIDIEWSVARTGVITPVGIVEPVELSGAMVSRASLHNYGMVKKMGLTKGARVLMMRRGGVIPNIEKVVKDGCEAIRAPKKCPSCGAETKLVEDFLYCTNPRACVKTRTRELEHFVKTIECDGFGRKLIHQLYDNNLVNDPSDFYRLTKDDLMRLERMGAVLADKLIRSINARREIPLEVFLRALGIEELGRHASEILASKYLTLDRIMKAEKEELSAIRTIGDVIAGRVVDGLKEKRGLIEKLLKEVRIVSRASDADGGPLRGRRFLFTGAMKSMERRAAAMLVEERGGKIAPSISKEVDYLVVGSEGGAGSKLEKAKKLVAAGAPIKIISEDEFLKMLL